MSLFGGHKSTPLAQVKPELHAMRVQTSSQGQTIPLQFGLGRLSMKLIWYGDFVPVAHTSTSSSSGGKGGGGQTTTTSTTYTYNASVDGLLCEGPITGVMSVWDTKGSKQSSNSSTTGVIPGSPFQVTVPSWMADLGASLLVAHDDIINDYGSDYYQLGRHLIVNDFEPMTIGSGAGKYTVSAGVYTFNVADVGKTYRIRYVGLPSSGTGAPSTQFGWNIFLGAIGQATWAYMTSAHPTQALGYSGIAHVAQQSMDLGSTGQLRNWSFEVLGLVPFAGGQGDAIAGDILNYLLTNHSDFPIGNLDRSVWDTHNKAYDLMFSPGYETQQSLADILKELCDVTNSDVIFSSGLMKVIPYTDTSARGNGALYTPPAPVVDLNDDDFIADDGVDPVIVTESPKANGYNSIRIEYANRANNYDPDVVENKDQSQIDTYGARPADVVKAPLICTTARAAAVADFKLKRALYIDGGFQYEFKIPWRYFWLDPMDLVTVSDTNLGLVKHPIRLIEIQEDADGNLDIKAEDFPWGTATATLYPKSDGLSGYVPQTQAVPGACATPFIWEPPARATQDGLGNTIWLGNRSNTQSPDYGGCNIYISEDNIKYKLAGTLYGQTRMGVIAAASSLPQVADPDTTSTMKVDLTSSLGTLTGGSQTDVDQLHTLMYVNGELVAFRDVALVTSNVYNLSYFRRGVYGTPTLNHSAGEQVVRIDNAIFSYKYDPLDVGKTLYVKCCAFNTFGNQEQPQSAVTATSYVLGGTGAGLPNYIHDALVMEGTCSANPGTLVITIANQSYVIASGDVLEYDMYLDPSNPDFKSGLVIQFSDLTDTNLYKDQNLIASALANDLTNYAKGQWYHRRVNLTLAAGKTTLKILPGFDASAVGFHRAKFANIKITNGTTVKATLWAGAPPVVQTVYSNVSYTTPKLYSQNDGGAWYALLIFGTSTGLNTQGSTIPFGVTNTPLAYSTGGTSPYILWTWNAITVYRPDGTTFVIPSSASMYNFTPPTPTVSQVAGGAKAAATQFVRIAYMKDDLIVAVGPATSIAVLINNVLKVTSPAVPAAFVGVSNIGWMPLVGNSAGNVFPQTAAFDGIPFGTDFTEPTAGARFLTTLGTAASSWFAAATATTTWNGGILAQKDGVTNLALVASTTYRFFFTYNSLNNPFVSAVGSCLSGVVNLGAQQACFSDYCTPLCTGTGATGVTPSAGGSGSGGGGGCAAEDHRTFCRETSILGVPFANNEWIVTKTLNGGIAKTTPRHRWTTKRGLVAAKDLRPLVDQIKVTMRDTGEELWPFVQSNELLMERGTAMSVSVPTKDKLYFCGAPDSTCDLEGHNLKP